MDARQKVKEGRQRGMEVASRIALDSYLRKDEYLAAHEGPMHDFREALMRHGYCRHFIEESWAFMPQEKDVIVPLVLKCFEQTNVAKERWWLLRWLYYKGLYEAVPTLIEAFKNGDKYYRWEIGDTLYKIGCPAYAREYLEMVKNPAYGTGRRMVILLLARIKCYEAVPALRRLLADDDVTLHVLCALGKLGTAECIPDIEPFLTAPKSPKATARRKEAKKAIERIQKREAQGISD